MNKTDLPIASPCNVPWTELVGSDAKRFCQTCQKHVHDLSQMTRGEARALLTGPATAGLCVRYLHDDEGTIMFREPEPLIATSNLAKAKRVAVAAAAVAFPLSLTACMGAAMPPPPKPMPAVPAASASASAAPTTTVASPKSPDADSTR